MIDPSVKMDASKVKKKGRSVSARLVDVVRGMVITASPAF
jgi:hypothetical protein